MKKQLRELPHYFVLVIVTFLFFFPFLWMVLSSFKSSSEVIDPNVILPTVWRFSNYREAMALAPFGTFMLNSLVQAVIIVAVNLITSAMAGFAFAKLHFKLKQPLFVLFLCTMMIPTEATIITNYLTISHMQLIDTTAAVVLPSLISVFGIFLLKQNFITVPDALLESAYIDGASDLRVFISICLPIVKGSLATLAIISFIGSWNSYLWPMLVTDAVGMKNVQTGMRYVIGSEDAGNSWNLLMAAATVLILPVTALFVFMQRYFVQGIAKVGIK
ncbi:MAG: carbohydrate ABC transporter permease [Clostridia bacterium]